MLLVVHGTDFKKARKKTSALLAGLQKKRPDAELFELNDETFNPARFEELLHGQGLFERKNIVFLDHVFSSAEGKGMVLKACKEMEESLNVFLLYEPTLTKKELTKLSKYAYKMHEFKAGAANKKEYKPFGLSDAVGKRSVKEGWNELQKAWSKDKKPEEIHGLLFWQIKSMILAASSKNAKEAGLKPFVYGKAKKGAANYTPEELYSLSHDLVERYHQARRGEGDLAIHIEEFVLGLKSDTNQ